MRFKSVILIFAMFIALGAAAPAAAGIDLPKPIAAELTLFPGATVLSGNSLPGGNYVASVNFGQVSLSKVYNYYKAKILANGFTIQTELMGTTIIASKGDINALVDLESEQGGTVGTLSITKDNGGQAQAAQAMPQPDPSTGNSGMSAGKMSMAGMGGQADYPDELAHIVKPYPGGMIMTSQKVDDGATVLLAIKNCSLADAVSYYQTGISDSGWNKEEEITSGGNVIMGYTKGDQELMVVVRDAGEALVVTLTLEK